MDAYEQGFVDKCVDSGMDRGEAVKLAQYVSPANRSRMTRGQNLQRGATNENYTPAAGGNRYGNANSAYAKQRAARSKSIAADRASEAAARAKANATRNQGAAAAKTRGVTQPTSPAAPVNPVTQQPSTNVMGTTVQPQSSGVKPTGNMNTRSPTAAGGGVGNAAGASLPGGAESSPTARTGGGVFTGGKAWSPKGR